MNLVVSTALLVVLTCGACSPDDSAPSTDGDDLSGDESATDAEALIRDAGRASADRFTVDAQAQMNEAGSVDYLMRANVICGDQCRAGCNLIKTQPDACPSTCFSMIYGAFRRCQLETQNYILCLGAGGPIFYCAGYDEASQCYAAAKVMVDCVNQTPP